MRFNAVRTIALVSIVLVFLFGFGLVGCVAEEPTAPAVACSRCEPITVIVGCAQCTPCDERDIQLCPPVEDPESLTIEKSLVIDLVKVENGTVIVFAHVDKFITYVDADGNEIHRLVRIEFSCNIPVEGIVFTDIPVFQRIQITEETDEVIDEGRTLHEKLCVKISVSLQRIIGCRLIS